jgi:ferrous iron transport protein B
MRSRTAEEPATGVHRSGRPVVALVGSPNIGKSSLFNALTGARCRVGNWPGTSVEVETGCCRIGEREVDVVDLPGAYSLDPLSPDEELTRSLLIGCCEARRPEVVVAVVSAADLARTLYLPFQTLDHPLRVVLAVTMIDVAERRGIHVDVEALARAVGVPVIPVDPRRGRLGELAGAVHEALDAGAVTAPSSPGPASPGPASPEDADDDLARADRRFARIAETVASVTSRNGGRTARWSDRADRLATHPVAGPALFLAVMWAVFQLTTTVAAPFQDALDSLVTGLVSDRARGAFAAAGLGGGWVEGLVVDGVIAGVGTVLTFIPLMVIMFCLLSVLEDSGYMARAALVADRLMRTIGLPGRAFLPLIVGFGCNVPAVSASRILPHARQRLLTVLLVPFTSCTARLPVYVLVASTFFGSEAGNVVFLMYVLSILLIILMGLLVRLTLIRDLRGEDLVLDLPRYQVPAVRLLLAVTWMRLTSFLRTAGGIIVAAVVVVWALSSIPVGDDPAQGPVRNSAYGTVAAAAEPLFAPAGFGDWHTTGTLVVGFVAKEAVVASWAQTYATSEPEDLGEPGGLGEHLRTDFERSSGGHAPAAALAFLVFLLGYTPCVATLAAQVREIGLRWTAVGVGLQFAIAWLAAVAIFQIGRVLA